MSEQELTELCKQGNRQAQKILYERYAGRMLSIGLRYVGSRAVAEDLLHDAYLQIYSKLDTFRWRGEGSLQAWMERVMVNIALQYLKENSALCRLDVVSDKELSEYEEPMADRINEIPYDELMKLVYELPIGYRTVFNLYVFEEKSHKEIAELLGIKEKSSSSQFVRAKMMLAKKVNNWITEKQ